MPALSDLPAFFVPSGLATDEDVYYIAYVYTRRNASRCAPISTSMTL
jgi:hypothetical protein